MKLKMGVIGGSSVLAKAQFGRNVLNKLLTATETEPCSPESAFLDFDDVEVATASFLRECVLGYRDALRKRGSNLYAVISNANETVEEELTDLLCERSEAMLFCQLSKRGLVNDLRLVGGLDPKHHQTFDLVVQLNGTDTATLIREHGAGEEITRTAWNNRLSALANLGLLIEESHGRAKHYRPVLREE